MKIRAGFVSNSSSSSFVLDASKLTAEQIAKIDNHSEEGAKLNIMWADDAWGVTHVGGTILLGTTMDNFDMEYFLEAIGATGAIVNHCK